MDPRDESEGERPTPSRRRVLRAASIAGLAGLGGCLGTGGDESTPDPTRTDTAAGTATRTPTPPDTTTERRTTEQQTTTEDEDPTTQQTTTRSQDQILLDDIEQRREDLTDEELAAEYRSGIPEVTDYNLDFDRVQEENDTHREQLVDITATVGQQYDDWVEGNHAVTNALHNMPWMNWEDDNILNIVTRYASRPGELVTANYSTEDGGRNLDGTIARGDASGRDEVVENIPDSEVMNGDGVNVLVTDMEAWEKAEDEEWDGDSYKGLRLAMQSIIPGIKGMSIQAEDQFARDKGIVFDSEALQYIGESYSGSAESANEVSMEGLQIGMATEDVRNSGRYVGITAGEDGLEVDTIYSQEEGREKLREPIEF